MTIQREQYAGLPHQGVVQLIYGYRTSDVNAKCTFSANLNFTNAFLLDVA